MGEYIRKRGKSNLIAAGSLAFLTSVMTGCSSTPAFTDLSPECRDLIKEYENAVRQYNLAMDEVGASTDIKDDDAYTDALSGAVDDLAEWGNKRDAAAATADTRCPPEWSTILLIRGRSV